MAGVAKRKGNYKEGKEMDWLSFLIGIFVGMVIGLLAAGLCQVAKDYPKLLEKDEEKGRLAGPKE